MTTTTKIVPTTPNLVQIIGQSADEPRGYFACRGILDDTIRTRVVSNEDMIWAFVKMADGRTIKVHSNHIKRVDAMDLPSDSYQALLCARTVIETMGAHNTSTMDFPAIRLFLKDVVNSKLTSPEQRTTAQDVLWNLEGL